MTLEQGFIALLSLTSGVFGWLMRELWGAVKELRSDLEELRVGVAEHYVRQDRMEKALERALAPVMQNLDRIEKSICRKADKP